MRGSLVAVGEVGLGGEVRQVGHLERRMAEAARLGFDTMLVPPSAPDAPAGARSFPVVDVGAAIAAAGVAPPPAGGSKPVRDLDSARPRARAGR